MTDRSFDVEARFGTVVSVSGSRAVVAMDNAMPDTAASEGDRLAVGRIVLAPLKRTTAVGVISALTIPMPDIDLAAGANNPLVEVELVGEISSHPDRGLRFDRGFTEHPTIGDAVHTASNANLRIIYQSDREFAAEIGSLSQADSLAATIDVRRLVTNHYALLGATGVGKSCAMVLLLRAIVERFSDFRIFIIDAHNEYKGSFGDRTVTLTPTTMNLPFWLFNFEEIVDVFFLGRPGVDDEVELLREIIPLAKQRYHQNQTRSKATPLRRAQDKYVAFSVDAPVPYRVTDLISIIDERTGKLESRGDMITLRRLRSRIETVSQDPRCAFMFSQRTVADTMVEVLGTLFRIPDQGKPISVVELAGLPAEMVDAVVSVLCRLAFDVALWSDGAFPTLVVCEEAHRYVPVQSRGFGPTRRAISRIAKEGRKYGLYLGLATQRPAELDPTILSQCGTVFAMRMSNDRDQDLLRATVPDALSSQIDFLPAMGPREALVIGEAVSLPMRLRFAELPSNALPSNLSWRIQVSGDTKDPEFLHRVVERWRASASHTMDFSETISAASNQIGSGDQPAPKSEAPKREPSAAPASGPAAGETEKKPSRLRRRETDLQQMSDNRLDWQALRKISRR